LPADPALPADPPLPADPLLPPAAPPADPLLPAPPSAAGRLCELPQPAAPNAAKIKAKLATTTFRFMGLLVGFMASGAHTNARFDQNAI
jgi:hypothetical protein